MKRIIYSLISVLLLVAGCSKDDQGVINGNEEGGQVIFNLKIGAGAPVTYAVHDVAEYKISSLTMFCFKEESGNFVLTKKVDMTSRVANQSEPSFELLWDVLPDDMGTYKFLFVANEKVNIALGAKLQDFNSILLNKQQAAGISSAILAEGGIPMTGFATQGTSSLIVVNGVSRCEVQLVRTVCRVDLRNRVPYLTVNKVLMKHLPVKSFLLPPTNAGFTIAPGGLVQGAVLPNALLPLPFNNGKDMPKAFYLFENKMATAAEAPVIEVTASLAGIPVFYSIPMLKDAKPMIFSRNYRYILQFGDGSSVVTPVDWVEDVINVDFALLSITESQTDGSLSYSNPIYTLSLDASAHLSQKFKLSTIFVDHKNYVVSVINGASWITASASGDIMTVDISANTTGVKREGLVRFYSDIFPPATGSQGTYYLKIVQL